MHSSHFYVIILSIHSVAVVRINLMRSSTSQSRPFLNHNSSLAIDGFQETCSITDPEPELAENSWWLLELDTLYNITDVKIFVASDLYGDFIKNLKIYAAKTQGAVRHSLCATFIKANYDPTGYNIITCKNPHFVKFIMIERFRGPLRNMLVLCEVRVYAALNTVNLALHRPTRHSGIFYQKKSQYSVDGNLDTCTIINAYVKELPWWRVLLDDSYYVTNVTIYFLANSTGEFAKKHVHIYTSNEEDRHETHKCGETKQENVGERGAINITCVRPLLASSVTIRNFNEARPRWMVLCDVHIYSKDEPKGVNVSRVVGNCSEHEYECYEDRCIHKDFLCDGIDDCQQGDDEAQSCRTNCGEGQFKCLRGKYCVDYTSKCDGVVNCPDYSDEQGCFHVEANNDLLKATYKGESDHYICSQGWKLKQSFDVCAKLGRYYSNISLEPISNRMRKFLYKRKIERDDLPFMRYFQTISRCPSGLVIKLHCELTKQDETESICGTRGLPDADFEPYIIKGLQSKYGAWPWHVQVLINKQYVCGASIIKDNWILTSAHCFGHGKFRSIHVMFDTIIRNDPNGKIIPASHLIIHPKYVREEGYSYHDIALLRLKSPIIYSKHVRPICLPRAELDMEMIMSYRYCLATGFGYIDRNGSKPKYLQEGRLNILSDMNCLMEFSKLLSQSPENYMEFITPETFCAGSSPTIGGINICRGDSGGPYVCKNDRRIWTLIGLITFSTYDKSGVRCTLSLFTKVDAYLDFIYKVFRQELTIESEISGACIKHLFDPLTYYIMIYYFAMCN